MFGLTTVASGVVSPNIIIQIIKQTVHTLTQSLIEDTHSVAFD